MSKFRVIDGDNVTCIAARSREIKQLELEISKKPDLVDRDLVVFAYHFMRLEHPLLAQKHLNMLNANYFDSGVYKDLSKALLAWSVSQANPLFKNQKNQATYEFFVVLKRALPIFEQLNFTQRPAFLRFKKELLEYSQSITLPHS